MAYEYPDKNDSLTVQLIDTEYDGSYWAESEEFVLSKAIESISALKEKDDEKRLLDVGCGKGRLIQVFAPYVDTITAVEPDLNRFSEAAQQGINVSAAYSKDVDVIHGDISSVEPHLKFDVILSSHVLQHITRSMTKELVESMSDKLEEDGLLILTTTHTTGEDQFFKEEWNAGMRSSQPITAENFDATFFKEGALPVRIFSEDTIINLAQSCNLSLEKIYCYHFKGHKSVEDDLVANRTHDTGSARDVMYIFRKKKTRITANIGYHFNFSIYDEKVGLRTDDEQELRDSIKSTFKDVIFYDDAAAMNEPILRELHISEDFLHGSNLPFNCFRALIKDYDLKFEGFDVFDSGVLLTVFPENDTVQLSVGLSLRDTTIDDLVYMRHVQGNGAKLRNKDNRLLSVSDIYDEIKNSLGRSVTDKEDGYIIEIKSIGDESNVDSIIQNYCKPLYGIMCGDEGWRHVPKNLALERLSNQWGSREFVRLISFGANTMLINLSTGTAAVAYRANRKNFDNRYYGDMNPYFLIDSNFAGINHGAFFSVELVMVIKTICSRILRKQAILHKTTNTNVQDDIKQTKLFRSELLTTLRKVESISISEVGEMEKILLVSHDIEPSIEKIKYLLELVESELDLLYQNSTNRLVNILTIVGLILSVIGVAADIYGAI